MPNGIIDMGFHSVAQYAIFNRTTKTIFGTRTSDGWPSAEAGARGLSGPYLTWMRDRVKTQLEAINGGANWRVGRIAEWVGASSGYHYAFKIEHMNSGVPSGNEWVVFVTGVNSNSGSPSFQRPNQGFGLVNDVSSYFLTFFPTGGGYLGMAYNGGGLSTTFSFDASLSDTFNTANDFNAPLYNPYTQDNQFFPDPLVYPQVKGYLQYIFGSFSSNSFSGDSNTDKWVILFNHEIPAVGLYMTEDRAHWPRKFWLGGKIANPRLDSDMYFEASVYSDIELRTTEARSAQGPYVYAINPDTGLQELFSSNSNNNNSFNDSHFQFTKLTQPRADGSFDKDLIKLTNASFDKGYLNPDLIAIMGPINTRRMALYDSPAGTQIKLLDNIVFPWTKVDPIFPAGYPTNGWFGPRVQDTVS